MIRLVVLVAVVCILASGSQGAENASSLYQMKTQYREVQMIEIVPGVVVRSDIWPDDYVPTVEDLVAIGVPIEDAERILSQEEKTTWGAIKGLFRGGNDGGGNNSGGENGGDNGGGDNGGGDGGGGGEKDQG